MLHADQDRPTPPPTTSDRSVDSANELGSRRSLPATDNEQSGSDDEDFMISTPSGSKRPMTDEEAKAAILSPWERAAQKAITWVTQTPSRLRQDPTIAKTMLDESSLFDVEVQGAAEHCDLHDVGREVHIPHSQMTEDGLVHSVEIRVLPLPRPSTVGSCLDLLLEKNPDLQKFFPDREQPSNRLDTGSGSVRDQETTSM